MIPVVCGDRDARPGPLAALVLTLALVVVLLVMPGPGSPGSGVGAAWAQTEGGAAGSAPAEPVVPLADRVDAAAKTWEPTLNSVESWLNRPWTGREDQAELDALAERLRGVRDEALQFRDAAAGRVKETEKVAEALGPPPEAGALAEPPQMRKRRADIQKDLTAWRTRLATTEVAITRAESLLNRVTEIRRSSLRATLFEPTPLPWAPEVLTRAGTDLLAQAATVAASPVVWARTLDRADWQDRALQAVALWAVLGGVLGGVIRWLLLRRFGRRPDVTDPTYVRRTLAAVTEGVANGIVPGVMVVGLILWERVIWEAEGLFPALVESSLWAVLFLVVTFAFGRAFLAPGLRAWRLSGHSDAQAQTLFRIGMLLGVVVATNVFLMGVTRVLAPLPETIWAITALLKVAEGAILVRLTAADVWMVRPALSGAGGAPGGGTLHNSLAPSDDDTAREGEGAIRVLLSLVRLVVVVLALVGMGAGLVGYGHLGTFLVNGLMLTGLVVGLGLILRGVLRDTIGLITGWGPVRRRLGLQDGSLEKVRFWLRAVLDPVLIAATVVLVAPIWQVPSRDVIDAVRGLLTGITIGSMNISPINVAVGIAAFLVAMSVTRVIQGVLQRKVLVQTGMESGARYALTAGLGYLGVVLAGTVAVAVMGIDLTNIAVIVGALSVGIGFGLQNIVNNFVSGLIILIERPVKVGDWVLIGAHEGLVKRINFRATELETWTQATVILPNAEILSQPFTNMTHRNRLGRIDVRLRAPFGADTDRVQAILLEVAGNHDQVLALPAPYVILADFGDSALVFELRCYTANVMNRLTISSDLRLAIDRRFRAAGLVMPYVHRVVLGAQPQPADAAPPLDRPPPPVHWMG